MEHLLEGIAPLRHWYINPNEKSNKYGSHRNEEYSLFAFFLIVRFFAKNGGPKNEKSIFAYFSVILSLKVEISQIFS